jgi:hypothetical protein
MSRLRFSGQTRREFLSSLTFATVAVPEFAAAAQQSPIIPLIPSVAIDSYKKAEARSLAKFKVAGRSRYVKLPRLSLTAHVLEAGHGDPVVLIHGGNATAVQLRRSKASSTHSRRIAPDAV